ncbi:MAG TPA: hypothetical protein VMF32_17990 [Xanthobacteraceae bacterium]|nr:hypothetical protein [Xanthobacteraceae bacterium]
MRYELTDCEWATIRMLPNKPRGVQASKHKCDCNDDQDASG